MRWSRPLPSSSAGGACAWRPGRWSTWALSGFAIAVAWFYFSDIFDKVGRSLGLIGLGILFLAGGWALEKMRRRIMAGMDSTGNQL